MTGSSGPNATGSLGGGQGSTPPPDHVDDRQSWMAAHRFAAADEQIGLAELIARSFEESGQIVPAADWAALGLEGAVTSGREVDQRLRRLVFRLQAQAIFQLQNDAAAPALIWPRIEFLSRHRRTFSGALAEPLMDVVLARAAAGMASWEAAASHLAQAQAHWDDCDEDLRAEILLIAGALSLGPGEPARAEPALRAVGRLLDRSTPGS